MNTHRIVGVHKPLLDLDVYLGRELAKLLDAFFEVLEKGGVEALAKKRIELRLVFVVHVALRKDAHAHFVERRGA